MSPIEIASVLIDAEFTIHYKYVMILQKQWAPLNAAHLVALKASKDAKPSPELAKLTKELGKMKDLLPQLAQALVKQQTLAAASEVRHDAVKINNFLLDIVKKLGEMRTEAEHEDTKKHLLLGDGHDLNIRLEKLIGADFFLDHLILKIPAVITEITLNKELITNDVSRTNILKELAKALTTLKDAKKVVSQHKEATATHIKAPKDEPVNTAKEVEALGGFFAEIKTVETAIENARNAIVPEDN